MLNTEGILYLINVINNSNIFPNFSDFNGQTD